MPTFNLSVHNRGAAPSVDTFEASGKTDARTQAVIMASELLREADGHFFDEGADLRVDVADDRGLLLYSIVIVGHNAPAAGAG